MRESPLDENLYRKKTKLDSFAKSLRRELTPAERLMWSLLRDKKFMGLKFRRQHVIQGYIIDFYCVEKEIGIELDGGQHNDDMTAEYDALRTETLTKCGVRIIRFWNNDIINKTNDVLEMLVDFVK